MIPDGLAAHIDLVPTPLWMKEIFASKGFRARDLEGVFNLGLGMIAAVDRVSAESLRQAIGAHVTVHEIGSIQKRQTTPVIYNEGAFK